MLLRRVGDKVEELCERLEIRLRLLTREGVHVLEAIRADRLSLVAADVGVLGEGFVRIAMVENEQRLRQAAKGIKKMIGGA